MHVTIRLRLANSMDEFNRDAILRFCVLPFSKLQNQSKVRECGFDHFDSETQ